MVNLDKSQVNHFFDHWDGLKGKIEKYYNEKDGKAVVLMQEAIANFDELLEFGGTEIDNRTGEQRYRLSPLNGEERFTFVQDKVNSHYAFVQLDALYDETRKKVARLSIVRKREG